MIFRYRLDTIVPFRQVCGITPLYTTSLVNPMRPTMAQTTTTSTFHFWGIWSAQNIPQSGQMNMTLPYICIIPLAFELGYTPTYKFMPTHTPSDLLGNPIL